MDRRELALPVVEPDRLVVMADVRRVHLQREKESRVLSRRDVAECEGQLAILGVLAARLWREGVERVLVGPRPRGDLDSDRSSACPARRPRLPGQMPAVVPVVSANGVPAVAARRTVRLPYPNIARAKTPPSRPASDAGLPCREPRRHPF